MGFRYCTRRHDRPVGQAMPATPVGPFLAQRHTDIAGRCPATPQICCDGGGINDMRELTVDLFAKGRNSPAYFGYGGPDLDAWIDEQLATPHVVLMGSNTYRALSEIAATGADPRMDELPKVVFSASLRPPLAWANTTLISDDVAAAVPA